MDHVLVEEDGVAGVAFDHDARVERELRVGQPEVRRGVGVIDVPRAVRTGPHVPVAGRPHDHSTGRRANRKERGWTRSVRQNGVGFLFMIRSAPEECAAMATRGLTHTVGGTHTHITYSGPLFISRFVSCR